LSQINALAPSSTPFDITTNGGAPMNVTTPTVTLSGTGYVDFHSIRLRGQSEPLNLTWSDYTHWSVTVPLTSGTNNVILDAYDARGNLVRTDSISVTTTAVTATPVSSLRITEMNYHPADPPEGSVITGADDYEYLELRNIGSTTINLAGVNFTNGITYTFPNINLAAGQYLILAKNQTAMLERYGINVPANQLYSGNLNNAGERLTLVDSAGLTILDFTFLDDDWIPAADGPGYSMVIVNQNASTSSWGTAAGWKRSANPDGSPGATDPLYVDGDYNRDGTVDVGDYVMLRTTMGTTGVVFTGADGNGNGVVDQADHAVWKANFGKTIFTSNGSGAEDESLLGESAGGGAAVPESSDATSFAPQAAGAAVAGASLPSSSTGDNAGGSSVPVPPRVAGDDEAKPSALPPDPDFSSGQAATSGGTPRSAVSGTGTPSAAPSDRAGDAILAWLAAADRLDRREYSPEDELSMEAVEQSLDDSTDGAVDQVFAALAASVVEWRD
jgi:hypothetical protein